MRLDRAEEAARHPERYFEGYPTMRYDDQAAYVTRVDFEALPEYSTSIPTGVCDGKVWKIKTPVGWLLGSFEAIKDQEPDVRIMRRHLIVLDDAELLAVTAAERERALELRVLGCRFATRKDGREIEITLRPLLFNNWQLCCGPRGDEYGFDASFMYDDLEEATIGFHSWAPDFDEHPAGRWTRDDNDHHGVKC